MKKLFLLLFAVFTLACGRTKVGSLPEPVTNNAVVALEKDNKTFIYSFFGLDSTKQWSGVHNKIFKIDLSTGSSSFIGNVPDKFGRLAASASVIRNKAYIVGGYAVFEDGKEKSSAHIFIFDPQTEKITVGESIPVSIDDQVQGVWRDSLLYVISGWSDSVNVNSVQVYNPFQDEWTLATPLPDEWDAKVFGGCGIIEGDTIYMLGGAMFEKFYPPSRSFYKGVINGNDPASIDWIKSGEYPGEFRYRSAAFAEGGQIIFFGGSNETYNYNGISYAEKKPVEPNQNNLVYTISTGQFSVKTGYPQVMDLRNVVRTRTGEWCVIGGMANQQKVSSDVSVISR